MRFLFPLLVLLLSPVSASAADTGDHYAARARAALAIARAKQRSCACPCRCGSVCKCSCGCRSDASKCACHKPTKKADCSCGCHAGATCSCVGPCPCGDHCSLSYAQAILRSRKSNRVLIAWINCDPPSDAAAELSGCIHLQMKAVGSPRIVVDIPIEGETHRLTLGCLSAAHLREAINTEIQKLIDPPRAPPPSYGMAVSCRS